MNSNWLNTKHYYLQKTNIAGSMKKYLVMMLTGFYLVIGMHFYIPNMGGSGLSLPQNIIAWMIILLSSLFVVIFSCRYRQWRVNYVVILFLLAAILFTLPLMWTPRYSYVAALPRIAGIWGALLFSLVLWQIPLSRHDKHIMLLFIAVSTVAEAMLSLFQWWFSSPARELMEYNYSHLHGVPYGIFQQKNLLASFLAVGYGLTVWYAYTRRRLLSSGLLCVVQFCVLFPLFLTQSRVGMFSALVVLYLLSLFAPLLRSADALRVNRVRLPLFSMLMMLLLVGLAMFANFKAASGGSLYKTLSLLLMLSGMVWCIICSRHQRAVWHRQGMIFATFLFSASIFWLTIQTVDAQNGSASFVHADSSLERINILRGTAWLIGRHPWAGVGLGQFEHAYPQAMQALGIKTSYVQYPHNEIFYVWSEGGILALAGLLFAFIGLFLPALRAMFHPGNNPDKNGFIFACTICMVPVCMHMLLEYPLYQSVTHLLVLLLLARLSQPEEVIPPLCFTFGWVGRLASAALGMVIFALLVVLCHGLRLQDTLTFVERHELQMFPQNLSLFERITQYERYDFDAHTLLLLAYNQSHDPALLKDYLLWGRRFLQVREDANVYSSAERIEFFAGNLPAAEALRQRATMSFHDDPRFLNAPVKNP